MKNIDATEMAFKHGYEKGYAAGKPKWIPVGERLPEKDGDYLALKHLGKHHWCDVLCFAKDGRNVDKYDFVDELVCYLLVCLPVHLILGYLGDFGAALSQFFIGQSAIWAILACDVWVAFVINMVIYGLFWIVMVAITHSVWNKNRIRK